MNKLTLLGLLSLALSSPIFAEEYTTVSEYHDEVNSHPEIISNVNDSLITFDEVAEPTIIVETNVSAEENNTIVFSNDNNDTGKEVSEEFDIYLNALQEAKSTGKMIILAIRATDCHYCDKMDRETLTDNSVQSALEKDFLMLHYNQDIESLPLGLQEGMTPIFVFVDKHENIINQYPGMRTVDEFKEVLSEILSQ